MDLLVKLKEKGWYLTDAGLNKILATTNGDGNLKTVIEAALDLDLREIAGGALPHKREDKPNGIVLQIQKVRNVAAPKANEDSKVAPRMLLLELTDGQTTVQALEMDTVTSLSINLPPGTKILLKGETIPLLSGYLQLRSEQVQVLGGHVQEMKEKWEIARSMNRVERTGRAGSDSGPPPWVPFGKKVQATVIPVEADFKSLQASNVQKKGENDSFNTFRSEAIAEATKQGGKKVFAGSGQQIVDHNMKKIMDKGYTEEEAKRTLAQTNNNLERAFGILKRAKSGHVSSTASSAPLSSHRHRNAVSNGNNSGNDGKLESTKPTGNVTLSEFLADKLPTRKSEVPEKDTLYKEETPVLNEKVANSINVSNNNQRPQKEQTHTQRINKTSGKSENTVARPQTKFENNMSSSFAAANQRNATVGGGSNSTISSNYNRNDENKDNTEHISKQNNRIDNNPTRGAGYENNNTRGNYRGRGKSNHTMENLSENKPYKEHEDSANYRQNDRNNRQNSRVQKGGYNSIGKNTASRNNGSSSSSNNNRPERRKNDNGKQLENGVPNNAPTNFGSISFTSKGTFNSGSQRWADAQKSQKNGTIKSKQVVVKTKAADEIAIDQYDSSKIIGFQSKETNELAMNLLKSQGVNIKTLTTTSSTSAQTATATMTTPQTTAASQQRLPQSSIESVTQPEHANQQKLHKQQNVNQFNTMQQQTPVHQNTNDYGMVPNETWAWKLGDICLAKYWDDGCYYEAEITAISDKTFVVYFMGYGNHEEVLKTDCLPITDVNHMAINNYTLKSEISQQHNNAVCENMQQRHRYERPVYVPPPKRSET